jgi:hypothetical protein
METLTFSDVQKNLKSIITIHLGGCGISAIAMYRWLKKNNQLPTDTKFVFFSDKFDYQHNYRCLKNNKGTPNSCYHIGLYYKKKYIDCKGMIDKKSVNFSLKKLKIKDESFVISALNNIYQWNTAFKREKHIPEIEEQLNVDLSDINIY